MIEKHFLVKHLLKINPNNPRYIKRYVEYLELCEETNFTDDSITYMEAHHILPKADDMFPEYSNFMVNPWNQIYLTAKQHIIAHILLKKAFPRTQSTIAAVHYYLNVQNSSTIDKNERHIPDVILAIYAAKAKEDFYKSRLGFSAMKSLETGEIFFLHKDDPKIKELGLVFIQYGTKHSEESKKRMSYTKFFNRKVTLYFLNYRVKVKLMSDDYDTYIAQGWTQQPTDFDRDYIKTIGYKKSSMSLKHRVDYMHPDGTYFGKLYKDDPNIEKFGLVYHLTNSRQESHNKRTNCAREFNLGSTWYNNGSINKKFKDDPGEPWVIGQINITDEARNARAIGVSKSRRNTICYNDGIRNFYFKETDIIPDNLVKGMAPQKPRSITKLNSNYEIWNDGINSYRIFPGDFIDPSWPKGMVKSQQKRKYCFTNGTEYIIMDSAKNIPGWTKCKKPDWL